ncbi:thiosulfate reductase cytochrome B subunit (membrane anchoring protein) [Herbaspirillum sp. CF444]|uniref:cytochrome b/b6 domain-containing protein n=1 Tax=Herbaspirillum sp. CF444 TaxID=1144319 RepID=UPI0002723FBB|nr:cytochrome b/b6 domain-containing protein [Herbaspirillum sp. CF444]EJL92612.1 thiosulfate reductase cytochrome B subunit (membrane anchoring protein) [Herbaspirillum sp. CF444]
MKASPSVLPTTPAAPTAAVHPLWLRVTHWINAFSVVIMIASGWRIYNASPIFPFVFPKEWTLGGWLGGALQWHFAAMWLLAINGIVYLLLNLLTGRARRKFFPLRPAEILHDFLQALKGKLQHASLDHYNAVQKLAYLSVILDLILIVVSGLAVWKSVQLPLLRELMGGFDNARIVHFFAMTFLVLFIAVHIVMVALVPRTLLAMLRGR